MKDWMLYERFVARLLVDELTTDMCVTPNARVQGIISGRSRQLDVLIDLRHDTDNSRRIIVDAKKRTRKIDVLQVEAFRGLMEDVGARHGYLVCPVGHTQAALNRAQECVTLRLISLDKLEGFDPSKWDRCERVGCANGYIFWDGFPELSLKLQSISDPTAAPVEVPFIYFVGKCDRCGRFHVKCLTCQQLFSLSNTRGEHRCACNPPWFWIASIEEDDSRQRSAELHVVLLRPGKPEVRTVSRRAL